MVTVWLSWGTKTWSSGSGKDHASGSNKYIITELMYLTLVTLCHKSHKNVTEIWISHPWLGFILDMKSGFFCKGVGFFDPFICSKPTFILCYHHNDNSHTLLLNNKHKYGFKCAPCADNQYSCSCCWGWALSLTVCLNLKWLILLLTSSSYLRLRKFLYLKFTALSHSNVMWLHP